MDYKKIILIIISVGVIFGLGFFIIKQKDSVVIPVNDIEEQTSTTTQSTEPQLTDFATKMPTDFPTDIPVEKGIKFEQSYSLNYVGQKQLTIVFLSAKTVKENYTLYADFLKKQDWVIFNKYESIKLSSLYGTKNKEDINVTISANTSNAYAKSQVSISILKK